MKSMPCTIQTIKMIICTLQSSILIHQFLSTGNHHKPSSPIHVLSRLPLHHTPNGTHIHSSSFPLAKSKPTVILTSSSSTSRHHSSTATIFLLLALLLLHDSINKVHCIWKHAWQDHQQQIYGQSHQSK